MRILAVMGALALSVSAAQAAEPVLKFAYTYPPAARAIPGLKAWLDRDAATLRRKMQADALADRQDAAKSKRPFNPYEADRTWKVVTDTPRFLSLSLEAYDYTDGAHGMTVYDGLVWDKATRQRLAPLSFFTSTSALAAAVKPAFCRQLDAERRRKRGGQSGSGTDIAEFNQCIDPAKETVILGSANGRQFTRIGFLIAPYDAGPYAEGAYEVTVPVTPAIVAAVKPEWRRYFAVAGQ